MHNALSLIMAVAQAYATHEQKKDGCIPWQPGMRVAGEVSARAALAADNAVRGVMV